MAKWKKRLRELALTAVVTAVAMGVVGYLRAPSYENAVLPPMHRLTTDGGIIDTVSVPTGPYVLHFWATWCPTCRAEAGNIDALAETHRVVTVAVKSGSDSDIEMFKRKHGLSFAVVNDGNGELASRFRIRVFPTTIIVGKDGKVFWSESGYTTTAGLAFRLWLAEISDAFR